MPRITKQVTLDVDFWLDVNDSVTWATPTPVEVERACTKVAQESEEELDELAQEEQWEEDSEDEE